MESAARRPLWVDRRRIAANQHSGRYQGVSRRSDQDFRFPKLTGSLRAITGRFDHPKRELTSGSLQPRLCENSTTVSHQKSPSNTTWDAIDWLTSR